MSIVQIKKAWMQGKGGGNTGAHQNFTDEMCRKTVIGRVCKGIINNSDDSALFNGEEPETFIDNKEATVVEEINTNANITELKLEAAVEQPTVEVKVEEPEPLPAQQETTKTKRGQQASASF